MIEIKQEQANSGRFKLINNLNRTPNERQINIIMDSMRSLDLSMYKPVMVYKNQIIDGQHRFLARERMGEPTYYVELDKLTDEQVFTAIHLLNSNAKNWSSMDYINLYSRMSEERPEFRDYQVVESLIGNFNLSPSIAIFFLSDFKIYKSAINEEFKNGKYKIIYPENVNNDLIHRTETKRASEVFLEVYYKLRQERILEAGRYAEMYDEVRDEVLDFYPKNQKTRFVKSPNFVFAFSKLASHENYNHDTFLVALKNDILRPNPTLSHVDSPSKYYEQLATIHNSRSKTKVPDLYVVDKEVQDAEEQEE